MTKLGWGKETRERYRSLCRGGPKGGWRCLLFFLMGKEVGFVNRKRKIPSWAVNKPETKLVKFARTR